MSKQKRLFLSQISLICGSGRKKCKEMAGAWGQEGGFRPGLTKILTAINSGRVGGAGGPRAGKTTLFPAPGPTPILTAIPSPPGRKTDKKQRIFPQLPQKPGEKAIFAIEKIQKFLDYFLIIHLFAVIM